MTDQLFNHCRTLIHLLADGKVTINGNHLSKNEAILWVNENIELVETTLALGLTPIDSVVFIEARLEIKF